MIAHALDEENFYPIDVLSWVTINVLKEEILSEEEQLEIEADILHVFEMDYITVFNT